MADEFEEINGCLYKLDLTCDWSVDAYKIDEGREGRIRARFWFGRQSPPLEIDVDLQSGLALSRTLSYASRAKSTGYEDTVSVPQFLELYTNESADCWSKFCTNDTPIPYLINWDSISSVSIIAYARKIPGYKTEAEKQKDQEDLKQRWELERRRREFKEHKEKESAECKAGQLTAMKLLGLDPSRLNKYQRLKRLAEYFVTNPNSGLADGNKIKWDYAWGSLKPDDRQIVEKYIRSIREGEQLDG